MKITVSTIYLLKKIQVLSTVVGNSNTLPILDNLLFELENNNLKLTASDLETTMSTTLNVESSDNGKFAVQAKMLIEILKSLPEQPLVFEVLENNIIDINSNSGKYSIAYLPGDDFPKMKELDSPSSITIDSSILSKAINKTIFATGTDDLRPVMTGVLFQMSPSGTNFAATDAHKLVKYSRKDIVSSKAAEFIVPRKPLNVLKGVLSSTETDVKVEYNVSNAKFSFEDYVLSCRLIEGKYPNYEAVIPKENPNKLTISRDSFLGSVKRVSIFSNRQTHQIRLKIVGNELNISTEDKDYSNKGDERLTCSYEGQDIQIGFNARFLTEMLTNLTSNDIMLEMSEPQRAGILTPVDGLEEGEELLMLVMPVRLD